jgi:hypothetical protein
MNWNGERKVSIIAILENAEGGRFFANAGKASGVSEVEAEAAIEKLAPAIAQQLKDKAAKSPEAFEHLLDLIEEGDVSELQQDGALTDRDAHSDGAAILDDLYGSAQGAEAALGGFAGQLEKLQAYALACISATAVLATLSASNAPKLAGNVPQAASSGDGGILSIILAALVKGLLQGARRQLAPRRRRRRYSSHYTRRPNTRKRKRSIGLDDVFREILIGR